MARARLIRLSLVSALALFAAAAPAARQDAALKDLMPKGTLIGVAVNQRQSDGLDTAADAIITRQFNAISPENLLKWQSVHPDPDRFTFDAQDRYVDFGLDHGMAVIGHNLVWHSQTPAWVFLGADGQRADRDTMLARMKTHIDTVVGRYKGRIRGWDVVNEALNDDETLRDSPWRQTIGDDYIAKAFEFAHAADPDAELYYNDYNLTFPAKRAGALRIVADLKSRGLRIDAVGEQGHWRLDRPTLDDIERTIADITAAGVKAQITELDINVLPDAPPRAGGAGRAGATADPAALAQARAAADPYAAGLPDAVQQQLADRYASIFRLFVAHHADLLRVGFWGFSDGDSWLNNYPTRGRTNYPLLWDRARQPKPAFDAIVRVLSGK